MEPPASTRETPAAADAVVLKDGVDLRRPLLDQMGALGADYDAWVHAPISPARAAKVTATIGDDGSLDSRIAQRWPRSVRIFRRLWLERMSHIPWWLIPLIWVPIVTALFLSSIHWTYLYWGHALAWGLLGLFLWTLTEYVLHRFAFHYVPKSAWGRKLHFLAHGVHHLDPWDPTRLVFPPLAAMAISAGIFGLIKLALPMGPSLATMSGLLAGYILYDMTHYYTHHAKPKTRWGKFLKAHHLAHHHKDWDALYGVSQPLWDIVFGTMKPREGRDGRERVAKQAS